MTSWISPQAEATWQPRCASFLSALLEWVVTSYLRAFDQIEATLEEFDVSAWRSPSSDPEKQIKMLVDARRGSGNCAARSRPPGSLPALSHSEFDPLSSEGSADRFAELIARARLRPGVARDAKDGIASSFDVLIVRTEHRTNEIIKCSPSPRSCSSPAR